LEECGCTGGAEGFVEEGGVVEVVAGYALDEVDSVV
jgi:hypothetical protein